MPALRAELDWAIDRKASVLLDLHRCEFLDSAMLAAIVRGDRALAERGLRMAGFGGGVQVNRLLEITGLGSSLAVAGSREAAILRLLF